MPHVIKLLLVFFLCTPSLFAEVNMEQLTYYLDSRNNNYSNAGAVLEEVSLLYLKCNLNMTGNVSYKYYDCNDSLRGELDIVIFEDGKITGIAEVKLWKDVNASLVKAEKQLERFRYYILHNLICNISYKGVYQDVSIFEKSNPKYYAVSYEGTDKNGFDIAVPITYEESHELYKYLSKTNRKPAENKNYCGIFH